MYINVYTKELEDFKTYYRSLVKNKVIPKETLKTINKASFQYLTCLDKQMIENDDKPRANLVYISKYKQGQIRFKLPKRKSKIRKRTGTLRRSFKITSSNISKIKLTEKSGVYLYSEIYQDKLISKYAHIQNYGGIIRAKRGRFLTIPIDKESFRKSPRQFSGTIVRGRFILKKVKKNYYKPLYLLTKKITLEPFFFAEKALKRYSSSSDWKSLISNLSFKIFSYLKNPS